MPSSPSGCIAGHRSLSIPGSRASARQAPVRSRSRGVVAAQPGGVLVTPAALAVRRPVAERAGERLPEHLPLIGGQHGRLALAHCPASCSGASAAWSIPAYVATAPRATLPP